MTAATTRTSGQSGDPSETRGRGVRFLVIGAALVLLGLAAIMLPDASTAATGTVLGFTVTIGGIIVVFQALRDKTWRGFTWQLLFGSVEIVGGLLIIMKPLKGAAAIALLVVIVMLAQAFTQFGLALKIRPARGWWWLALASLVTALIGVGLALRFPYDMVDSPGEVAGLAMMFRRVRLPDDRWWLAWSASGVGVVMTFARLVVVVAAALFVTSCRPAEDAQAPVPPRLVRTVTVGAALQQAPVVFPGRIEAKDVVDFGFRIGGRMTERLVGVGAVVGEGQVLARLDPEVELNDLRSARAALLAAESGYRQAMGRYDRQSQLYGRRVASRAEFEAAEQAAKAARSQVEASQAQVRIAEEVVGFTTLKADAAGVVTSIGAEPGEVVAAGQPVLRVARRDGRDVVFDVPAANLDLLGSDSRVIVTVPGDPQISVKGRVREVSPEADPVTRLFRVRVGLADPPASLRLGMSADAALLPAQAGGTQLPASALMRKGAADAVWVVDPATGMIAPRPVELVSEDPASIVVSKGLSPGDVVITAGVSSLAAGQTVRVAELTP